MALKAFQADQDSGLVMDPLLSFNFISSRALRHIRPRDILAIEFFHNHLVVVYMKETKEDESRIGFFAAVVKKNENNDHELKTFRLESDVSDILRREVKCKITPSHIIISYLSVVVIFDFAYSKYKELKI